MRSTTEKKIDMVESCSYMVDLVYMKHFQGGSLYICVRNCYVSFFALLSLSFLLRDA